jgi:hypothetical protein
MILVKLMQKSTRFCHLFWVLIFHTDAYIQISAKNDGTNMKFVNSRREQQNGSVHWPSIIQIDVRLAPRAEATTLDAKMHFVLSVARRRQRLQFAPLEAHFHLARTETYVTPP